MCLTEHDRVTFTYCALLVHAKKVASKSDTGRSAVSADLAPSCSATDSGSLEGKLGRCDVAVVGGGSCRECRVGGIGWNRTSDIVASQDSTERFVHTPLPV